MSNDTYRAAMDRYPKCACGQGLWAPISQQRGYCEACRLTGEGVTTRSAEGGSAG